MARHANADSMKAAAGELGFTWHEAPFEMSGTGLVETVPIVFEWVSSGLQGAAVIRTAFDPPLALDLRATSRAPGGDERVYKVTSAFPPTADVLLSDWVRASLDSTSPSASIEIDDHHAELRRGLHVTVDPSDFVDDIRKFARAMRVLRETRATAPVMTALSRHTAVLAEYARQSDLTTWNVPPSAFGRVAHGSIDVHVVRLATTFGVVGALRFEHELQLGLDLVPAASLPALSRVWATLSGADVKIGDESFDANFVIRTTHPDRVGAVLSPDVRSALASAHARYGAMRVNDKGITLGPISLDDNQPLAIADVATTLTVLAGLFAEPTNAQPYR